MPDARPARHVVMLSTAARGGMRSVVEGYRRDGLFDRWNVRLIDTHVEGGIVRRLGVAISALAAFASLLTAGRVGLVHCHVAMRGSFWRKAIFVTMARAARVPVILHLHGSEFERFFDTQRPLARRIIAHVFGMSDRVLVLSENWRNFIDRAAPGSAVEILPNYVVMPPAGPPRTGPVRTFLFLGLLGQRKGIFDLIPAFRDARTVCPDIVLSVGGNGALEEAKAQARSLQAADAIRFEGWVDGPAKERLLAEADVYVLPSYNEGLPMSILEAMSWGLPIISTDVGGIPELVRDGIDGRIVSPGDVGGLTAAIAELARGPAACRAKGAAARERVETGYARDTVLPRLERLYRDLFKA